MESDHEWRDILDQSKVVVLLLRDEVIHFVESTPLLSKENKPRRLVSIVNLARKGCSLARWSARSSSSGRLR
jgi:hypothetical protein